MTTATHKVSETFFGGRYYCNHIINLFLYNFLKTNRRNRKILKSYFTCLYWKCFMLDESSYFYSETLGNKHNNNNKTTTSNLYFRQKIQRKKIIVSDFSYHVFFFLLKSPFLCISAAYLTVSACLSYIHSSSFHNLSLCSTLPLFNWNFLLSKSFTLSVSELLDGRWS